MDLSLVGSSSHYVQDADEHVNETWMTQKVAGFEPKDARWESFAGFVDFENKRMLNIRITSGLDSSELQSAQKLA